MVTVQDREYAVRDYGQVVTVRKTSMPDGREIREYQGTIRSTEGIVEVYGHEETGWRRNEQVWRFTVIDPDRIREHSRREVRTRCDFLTTAGAKRVALRWVRGLWN